MISLKNSGSGEPSMGSTISETATERLMPFLNRLRTTRTDDGTTDRELRCVDGSAVRARRCAAGGEKKRFKRANWSWVRLFAGWFFNENPLSRGRHGLSLGIFTIAGGQAHETTALLRSLKRLIMNYMTVRDTPLLWPVNLAGDKGTEPSGSTRRSSILESIRSSHPSRMRIVRHEMHNSTEMVINVGILSNVR